MAKTRKSVKIDYKKMHEGTADRDESSGSAGEEVMITKRERTLSSNSLIEEIKTCSQEEDEEINLMKNELHNLEEEAEKLKKLRQKEELRHRLQMKREEVKKLKGVRQVVVVGDSIIKNIPWIEGVKLQSFPGATIGKLSFLINQKKVDVYDNQFVIIHVGTNNISNGHSLNSMSSDFTNLIATIRQENPLIKIIVSSILPRPVDHDITDEKIKEFNHFLEDVLSKDLNFKFIRSYRAFCYKGQIKRFLFAKLDGGLHLNSEGSNRLGHFLLRVISNLSM